VYIYDVYKLCRKQAGVILNHANRNVRGIGQGEARHRKYKRLKLGGRHMTVRLTNCSFRIVNIS
jgi:hypothetical protein